LATLLVFPELLLLFFEPFDAFDVVEWAFEFA
jgi:hypothetical protein